MGKKAKKAVRKGKKQRTGRKHESIKAHTNYEIKDSSSTKKKRSCPRCGTGTWLANHKNRAYCGRCGYTEMERKVETPVEEPKQPLEKATPKIEENKEEPKVEEKVEEKPKEEEKKE